MPTTKTEPSDGARRATSADVRHVLGQVEDVTVAEILAAEPTFQDLADASIWARGDGDLLAREHKELSASAIAVAEILTREEEEISETPD